MSYSPVSLASDALARSPSSWARDPDERARNATPAAATFRSFLASGYVLKADIGRAAAELAEAQVGDDRYSSIACLRAVSPGLRNVGMPEK